MAGQSITFDFLTRGADSTASGFRKVGDNTVLAARGARVLSDAIEKLGKKEDRTAAESVLLAKALRQTGDAEDRVAARAVVADAAIRRLDDAMQDTNKHSGELGKTLSGLKLNPGLVGPLLALAPAIATLGGVGAGAAAGLGGAFIAGGAALAAFGAVAKPVLSDAKKAAGAVEKAQNAYNTAISNGVAPSKAFKAEQLAISKAYAGMSPAQIALSKQLGDMANAWDKVKTAETPVVTGALQPWLKSVTGLTSALGPIIAKIAPVIASLGGQFNSLVNSSAFKGFRDFIGSTGSAAVSAGGSTIIDLVKSFMILLPKFDPLIREAIGWISRLGPAVLSWASSKKAADDITRFLQWFSKNGPVVGGLLKNIGGALAALAPGLTSGGALELKVISGFLGLIAKLPPAIAKPLAEVAGAALILSKLGVLKVGLQVVGPAVKWLSGGLINLGGGAAAGAEIRAAMVSGGAAAAAEIRAALAGGGAAAGAEGAAGGAAAGAKGKLPPIVTPFAEALGPVLSGIVVGAAIKAIGDTLSPKGTFAGKLNQNLQKLAGTGGGLFSTSLLHSFTFGGLEAKLTTSVGLPVGKVLNDVGSGAKIWGKGLVSSVGGFFSSIAHGAAIAFGNVGDSAKSGFGVAGQHADTLRTRSLVPLQGEVGRVSGGIQGLSGIIQGTMLNALRAAGAKSDALRTQNLSPLLGEVGKVSGGVQGLQRSIDAMHGKTVNVGVHASGSGGMTFTQKVAASISSGGFSLRSLAGGGLVRMGSGPTADDVPAMLSRGELVVPAHMVKAGAADNLRGRIPGFAGGGIAGVVPFAAGAEYDFGRSVESALLRAEFANLKAAVAAAAKAKAAAASASAVGALGGPTSASASQAQAYASGRLGAYGWSAAQMKPLILLWNQESGWNRFARNPSSGAYGIPQALPPGKMGAAANPPTSSAAAQINWGLSYIKGRYGSPAGAWAHEISNNWYGKGGLVPGYASGGSVAQQGRQYLNAWQTRHGGPYALAVGPKVLNEQIPEMQAAIGRAATLSHAGGLSAGQHKFWANAAAGEKRLLATLLKERTTERAWRTQLGLNELGLDKEIKAAGNLKSLAGPVRGWKAQLGRDKATVTAISKMLGYSDAYIKAHPAPKPGPVLPKITHTYGGDVANNLGVVLAAALGPFTGAARGGLVMDSGGTLRPGFNPVWNMTGRPEPLVPARSGGGKLQIEWVGGNGGDDLERWIRKNVRIRGGGDVQKAYGAH